MIWGIPVEYTAAAFLLPEIARITGETDLFEVAEAAAGTVLSSPSAGLTFIMWARAGLAMVAVQQGDTLAAEEQRAALEYRPAAMVMFTVCDRLLGLLSVTLGELDQAAANFEEALAFCRKAGYGPELAWTCCDYSDMLLKRDGEGDRAKAVRLLEESLTISSELGMRPSTERVLSRREILRA